MLMNISGNVLVGLQYYLVSNPSILNFRYTPNQTFGGTLLFLASTIVLYLSTTFLFHVQIIPTPSLHPSTLRNLSTLHNILILLLSLVMSIGCAISSLTQIPSYAQLFCFPPVTTTPSGPVFFWAYVFYLSKIYEFVDTVLIILNKSKKLSFLHVYHHAMVVVMCYVWLETSQSLIPIALVTNASVHILMYAYYLCSSLGWRWSVGWKRVVTNVQIFQFGFSFMVSLVLLWMHFRHGGCSGMGGWTFNAVFNASLFVLFLDFHRKSYGMKKKKKK